MDMRSILITEADYERLATMVDCVRGSGKHSEHVQTLESTLDEAQIIEEAELPKNVITMDSTVVVRDLDTKEQNTYTLVYPTEADFSKNRISVLAPCGIAMIGHRVGDVIEWKVPSGIKRFKVEKVQSNHRAQ